ncbi:hypothetical protein EB796_023632 [Bugula neritina]|uniref:t-SNARE coiled-coil homology domain-containing protein n=1 Tax=Bugula neritina TaxID=10212 RepID=A0A7J7IXC1_BUGNE|nr:hypothetical protein EB796_023632 [Bugula neritina]
MSSYYGQSTGYQSGSGTSNDFDRLASSISMNIQKMAQNTNRCQRLVDQLGTPQDRDNLTNQIQDIQHNSNELAKTTSTQLKNLADIIRNSPPNVKKSRELQKSRLTDDFTSILNKVQKVQREAADKEKASVIRARANSANASSNPFADNDDYGGGYSDDMVNYGQHEKKQSLQAVIDEEENLAAIQEREAAIKNLEADIVDVNQIFKDLGALVYEQGEVIDSIESNVETASHNVEAGNVQLASAAKYQSAARRKKCICFIILAVAAIVVTLIIVIPIVLKNQKKSN